MQAVSGLRKGTIEAYVSALVIHLLCQEIHDAIYKIFFLP